MTGDAVDRASVERATVPIFQGDGQRGVPAAAHELHPRDSPDEPGTASSGQLPPVLPTAGKTQG